MCHRPSRACFPAAAFVCALALPSASTAQCSLQWQPGAAVAGIGGDVYAAVQLANGDLVVGGQFLIANSTVVNNLARWDGTTWHALGSGCNHAVLALTTMANGDLIAAGAFTTAGGIPAAAIASWNGTNWSPLGTGIHGHVTALLTLPNNTVIAGGSFQTAGGVPAVGIASWNGSAWSPLGGGLLGVIDSLAYTSSGEVLVGGDFAGPVGIASPALALWNGASWLAVPGLQSGSRARSIVALPNNEFVAVGTFSTGLSFESAMHWSAGIYTPIPLPQASWFSATTTATGEVVFGGASLSGPEGRVVRWNGVSITDLGNPTGPVTDLVAAANGDLFAAGFRGSPNASTPGPVARYAGGSWLTLGAPAPPWINAMARTKNGDVIVGGLFTTIGGVAANNIARRTGSTFAPLGAGVGGRVRSLAVAPDGSIVAAGDFMTAGGVPAARIARWANGAWSSVGNGLVDAPEQLAAGSNAQVLAARQLSPTMYFDGTVWSQLAIPGTLVSLTSTPQGDFVLAGYFSTPTGFAGTVRFNQGGMSFANGLPSFSTLVGNDVNGRVLAMQDGLSNTTVHRLDGNTWTQVGTPVTGYPWAMASLANSDPILVFPPSTNSSIMLRWNGSSWVTLATPLIASGYWGFNGVQALSSANGDVILGGDVLGVNGTLATGLAIAVPTCPAAAVPVGPGCTGSGGPLQLAATNLPWVGGTLSLSATGFPPLSLGVLGLGTTPLAGPLPGGAPGCGLWLLPERVDAVLPTAGTASIQLAVPNALVLAGLQFRAQVGVLELDALGNLVALTSTNALQMTIGGV